MNTMIGNGVYRCLDTVHKLRLTGPELAGEVHGTDWDLVSMARSAEDRISQKSLLQRIKLNRQLVSCHVLRFLLSGQSIEFMKFGLREFYMSRMRD